ncbi:MAG: FGGY-family carbohydrate kinase, partial [Peptidiphaga sp.]
FTPGEDDPFFVPYVNGTSVIPDGRAEFVGLTAFHDIRHIVRAVYEGVIFSHMYHIAKLREYTTLKGHVRFTGGAANSKIWTQMFADAIGAPVDVVDAAESGTLGTAICSAVAAGLYPDIHTAVESMTSAPRETVHPNPEFTDLFRRRYARFRRHIDVLAGNAAAGPADAPAPEASGPSASTPAPGEPEKKED